MLVSFEIASYRLVSKVAKITSSPQWWLGCTARWPHIYFTQSIFYFIVSRKHDLTDDRTSQTLLDILTEIMTLTVCHTSIYGDLRGWRRLIIFQFCFLTISHYHFITYDVLFWFIINDCLSHQRRRVRRYRKFLPRYIPNTGSWLWVKCGPRPTDR